MSHAGTNNHDTVVFPSFPVKKNVIKFPEVTPSTRTGLEISSRGPQWCFPVAVIVYQADAILGASATTVMPLPQSIGLLRRSGCIQRRHDEVLQPYEPIRLYTSFSIKYILLFKVRLCADRQCSQAFEWTDRVLTCL